MLRGFDASKVRQLLEDNFVILDGEAIQVVIDLGLQDLLNIEDSTWHEERTNYQSFEEYRKSMEGIEKPRVSMLQHIGAYLQNDYQKGSDTQILSDAYNAKTEKLGSVMALVNKKNLVNATGGRS